MLKDIPKPPAKVITQGAEAMGTSSLDEVVHTPVTPVTPVMTEALTSFHDLIIKDTDILDRTSKDRLQKRIQKMASAAKVSFAE